MRIVGVIRLSHATEQTTSPERQREIIETWCRGQGHTVIGWAEDINVSASVPPWDRPELGDWLTRQDEYDALVCWRLDRVVRRVLHFAQVIEWLREHSKGLMSVTEGFDLGSQMGRILATLISMMAEWELESISERTTDSRAKLRGTGRFPGGHIPFGHMVVQLAGGGWTLKADPEYQPVAETMADKAIEGYSRGAIATHLTKSGALTPRDIERVRRNKEPTNAEWDRKTISILLKSRSVMLGEMVHHGKPVRNADGSPVMASEPLISREKWNRLQRVLAEKARTKGPSRENASLLLSVAFCGVCGQKMYFTNTSPRRGRRYPYYMCASRRYGSRCSNGLIPADKAQEQIEAILLAKLNDVEVRERVIIAGEDHTEELERVAQSMTDMRQERLDGLFDYPGGEDEYQTIMRSQAERRARLASLPHVPAREEWRGTGKTFAELWEGKDHHERNLFLRSVGLMFALYTENVAPDLPAGNFMIVGPGGKGRPRKVKIGFKFLDDGVLDLSEHPELQVSEELRAQRDAEIDARPEYDLPDDWQPGDPIPGVTGD